MMRPAAVASTVARVATWRRLRMQTARSLRRITAERSQLVASRYQRREHDPPRELQQIPQPDHQRSPPSRVPATMRTRDAARRVYVDGYWVAQARERERCRRRRIGRACEEKESSPRQRNGCGMQV